MTSFSPYANNLDALALASSYSAALTAQITGTRAPALRGDVDFGAGVQPGAAS